MDSTAVDLYVEAFRARWIAMRRPGQAMLEEPGMCGLLPEKHARAGMITVCAAAAQCTTLLSDDPSWRADSATAMICRDLCTVPAFPLLSELALRPGRRRIHDAPDGVPLTEAVAAAGLADPRVTDPQALVDYLESLPAAFGLFAAVDGAGVVRATSGSGVFGATASVIFVNTDPGWRRRGIALAMTSAALRSAQQSGARNAGLDASDAGRELYLRLGFDAATPTTRFRASA